MSRRTGALGIAAGAIALVIAANPVAAPVARAAGGAVVVVQPGDTLSAIALRHRTTVARLAALNHLVDPNLIFAGQRILLEVAASGTSSGGNTAKPSLTAPPKPRVHVVRAGEHLTGIARRYGTTIDAIVQLNRIANPNRIFAGQQLLVPAASATTASAAGASSPSKPAAAPTIAHRVVPGETLTSIAHRYGTTIAAIMAVNHLVDANVIRPGEVLHVPSAASTRGQVTLSSTLLGSDAVRRMTARRGVQTIITAEAKRAGIPVAFALAVAWQESGWQQGIVSNAGAIGVMQLLPTTADWVATSMLHAPVNVHDTRQNVRAGVTLLAHYLARYQGNRTLALAAYYQGQRSVDVHGIYPVSRPYVASVLALEAILGS